MNPAAEWTERRVTTGTFPAVLADHLRRAGGRLYLDGEGRLRAKPHPPAESRPCHPVGLGDAAYTPSAYYRYRFATDADLRAVMAACDHPAALTGERLAGSAAEVRAALDQLLGETP